MLPASVVGSACLTYSRSHWLMNQLRKNTRRFDRRLREDRQQQAVHVAVEHRSGRDQRRPSRSRGPIMPQQRSD
jgi:hypothetical protein